MTVPHILADLTPGRHHLSLLDENFSYLDAKIVNVSDFGAVGDGTTDDTAVIQAAINAAHSAGGGKVLFGAKTYACAGIELKTNVVLEGVNKQTTRLLLLPGKTNSDLIYTTNFYTLFGTEPAAADYPWRLGLKDMTLDGNGWNNTTNARGRGFVVFASGLYMDNVCITACWRHGFISEAPQGGGGAWPRTQDDVAGEGHLRSVNIQHCGLVRGADVPGGVGEGGVYFNGPSDTRFDQVFVGWNQGGYGIKIGPKGPMRWLGGEIFGGGSPDPRVNLTGTSVTRSGTTATVTCANHGRKVGEMFNMFGGMDAAFRIVGTVTAVTTNTFTYTLDSAAGADYTGEVVIAPVICAEWGIISECQNGFDGYHVNLSCGGYKGEALVRRNGFRHKTNHNYVIAGDGTHARIIHKCYQIGDTANGFTNVAGVFIEAYHEDLLGPQVDYNSSAGFNRVQIRGYVNYSGMSVTPTGTLHAKDEVNIVIDGSSTCNTYQAPYTHW